MVDRCPVPTARGTPCRGRVLPGRPYCLAHDPALAGRRAEGSRRGGEARATARRTARQWAAIGEQLRADDLPAILRAALIDVREGKLEPNRALAMATLARTSVSLAQDLELEQRLARLEAAAGLAAPPPHVRRIG